MNIFQILRNSQYEEMCWKQSVRSLSGYEPFTTFWSDLTICELTYPSVKKQISAIKDTYKNVVSSWLSDYKYFTEFILVLNHKIWKWYEKDEEIARVYDTLWRDAENKFYEKYTGNSEVMSYYYRVTD